MSLGFIVYEGEGVSRQFGNRRWYHGHVQILKGETRRGCSCTSPGSAQRGRERWLFLAWNLWSWHRETYRSGLPREQKRMRPKLGSDLSILAAQILPFWSKICNFIIIRDFSFFVFIGGKGYPGLYSTPRKEKISFPAPCLFVGFLLIWTSRGLNRPEPCATSVRITPPIKSCIRIITTSNTTSNNN